LAGVSTSDATTAKAAAATPTHWLRLVCSGDEKNGAGRHCDEGRWHTGERQPRMGHLDLARYSARRRAATLVAGTRSLDDATAKHQRHHAQRHRRRRVNPPVIDAAILGWPRAPAPSEWSDVPTFYPIGAAIAAAATTTTMPEADHVTWLHDDDVTLFSSPAPQARSGRLDSCK